ncbi:MAG: protein kinase [Chloroflexota bacterium]|nr:protein kinase [Chloroflexota bacterium]
MSAPLFCPACGGANEAGSTHCFACQHLLPPESSSHDGTLLQGRYELGTCLGSGGYSLVYRARDRHVGDRVVAIKQISLPGLSATAAVDATETFHREVRILSNLNHPQVPHLYDHFGDRDHWYLVLEYIEGQTLETYLATRTRQGRPLSWQESIALMLQLCPVLEYLHSRQPPVIFRDLKPGNIMRTPRGTLCLIDFGIARHYQPGLARDTQRLGSPGYAAPEQYGQAQTTPQTDLYSLGALLHFLLSGQDPSERGGTLPPLRLNAQAESAQLERLVERLLSPNPSERPANIREVATALQAIRSRHISQGGTPLWRPTSASPPQSYSASGAGQQQMYQPVPPVGSSLGSGVSARITRRRALIGLGVVTVALGGSVWWLRGSDQGISPAPLTAPATVGATPPATLPATLPATPTFSYTGHSVAVMGVAWSPNGKRIASADADGMVQVWDAVDGSHILKYRGHASFVYGVAWSPDGKRLASTSDDTTVQVWDAVNGGHIFTYTGHAHAVYTAVWSRDGKRLASASEDHTVQVWDAVNGRHIFTYTGHTKAAYGVAWSRDGKRLASASNDHTVQVWDAVDGRHILTYTGHTYAVTGVAWSPNGKHLVSASSNYTVQVWNTLNGGEIITYPNTQGPVAWSPDGKQIVFASPDNTVQEWKIS